MYLNCVANEKHGWRDMSNKGSFHVKSVQRRFKVQGSKFNVNGIRRTGGRGRSAGLAALVALFLGLMGQNAFAAGAAASIAINAGNNQSAPTSTNVPILPSVIVKDAQGVLVNDGTIVTFSVTNGSGTITGGSASTVSGIATVGSWKLGSVSGNNNLSATTNSLTAVLFSAIGQVRVATVISINNNSNNQTVIVNNPVGISPSVFVKDQVGDPINDGTTTVTFRLPTGSGGSISANQTPLITNGVATLGSWTLAQTAGANSLQVTCGAAPLFTISATGIADVPATVNVNVGNNQSAAVNQAVSVNPSVLVKDQFGNLVVNGTQVTFAVATGGGSVTGGGATTTNGVATVGNWTLGATAGTNNNTLTATANGFAVTFTASANALVPTMITAVSGNGQSATVNTTVTTTPSFLVKDQVGNPVADGTVVTIFVASGGGAVTGGSTTTINGVAALGSWTLGTTAGANALSVTCGNLTVANVVTATALADIPTKIVVTSNTNGQQVTVASFVPNAPSVTVKDQFNNPVANGTAVTFAITAGNGTIHGANATTTSGVATLTSWQLGSVSGLNTLSISCGAVNSATITATGVADVASTITFVAGNNQTGKVNTNLPVSPTVQVQDQFGNFIANNSATVVFAIVMGNGTISGSPSANASTTNGVASVTNWLMGKLVGTNTLTVSCGQATPITFQATSTPDVPNAITVSTGNAQSATVNTAVSIAPVISVKDQFGNNVANGLNVTFAVASGAGSITGGSTTTANGSATLGSWKLGNAAGANSLTVSCNPATSATITATGIADVGTSIAINAGNNQSATIGKAVATPPSVIVRDQFNNNVVDGTVVTYAVVSGGGSITGAGAMTVSGVATLGSWTLGSTPGTNTLTATTGSLTPLTFSSTATQLSPATIAVTGGNNQTALVKSTLPIAPTVLVTDQLGNPVADGTAVTFSIGAGAGTLTGANATTTNGVATVGSWTLGKNSGANTLIVSAGSAPTAAVTAAGTPDLASLIVISAGNAQSAIVGTNVVTAPSVTIKDQYGNVVKNGTAVTFAVTAGGGSIVGASQTTTNGVATLGSWTLGTVTGFNSLTVTCGAATASTIFATGNPDAATTITINGGNNQTAKVGASVTTPPSVLVKDQYGNTVANLTQVTFAVLQGGGSVSGGVATTTNGVASVISWTMGNVVGANQLSAVCGGASPVFFSATGTVDVPATITVTAGNAQSAKVGTSLAIAPSVRVTDRFGNVVTDGSAVTFSVTTGSGILTGATTTTSNGQATLGSWKLGTTAGANTLTVSCLAAQTATVTGTGTPDVAATIAINAGNNQAASVNSTVNVAPSVIIKDQYKNTVADGTVATFSVTAGGGSITGGSASTINGIATLGTWKLGAAAGTNTMTATTGALLPVTFNAVAVPLAPTSIVINTGDTQTATVNTKVALAPSVLVKDQQGNPTADGTTVTFTITSGAGTITGGTALTTNGIATLGSWTLGKILGTNTLSVTCASAPALTITATGVADAPASVVATAGNAQSATVGTNVAVAPAAIVKDQYGNLVPDGTLVLYQVVSGGGSISGGVASTLSGVATLTSWTLGSTPGANSISATCVSLQPLLFIATATAIAPASIALNAGGTQSATVNKNVAIAPSVVIKDANGNLIADGTTVTFTVATGGGTVVGGTATTTAGIATLGSWKLGTSAGPNSLTVTSGPAQALTISATGTPDVPATITINNNNKSATVGTAIAPLPVAIVKDQFGNTVANGTTVTFAVATGGGSVTGSAPTTNAGAATLGTWTLGTTSGANTLTVTSGTAPAATVAATGNADVANAIAVVSGDNQIAKIGSTVAIAPSVKVVDKFGNLVSNGTAVNFSVASGGGTITGGAATTTNGIATLGSWKLGTTPGANTLSAKSGTTPSVTFTATAIQPPTITSFASSGNPGLLGAAIGFSFAATGAPGATLNYTLDFGDGSAPATGTMTQTPPTNVGYAYTSPSSAYTLTLTVSDPNSNTSATQTLVQTVLAPSSGGTSIANISTTDKIVVTNPIDGISISVPASNGGVLQYRIDGVTAAVGDVISTHFNDPAAPDSSGGTMGDQPVHKYTTAGIYIVDTQVKNPATNAVDQHGRKTIVIGANENGETSNATGLPTSSSITTKSLKGKFVFGGTGSDTVSFSGTIGLPPGLKAGTTHTLSIGIGNIIGTANVDAKGNGKPTNQNGLSVLKVAFKIGKGGTSTANDSATITATFTKLGLVAAGFNTEGLNTTNVKSPLKIQVGILLDGVAYETLTPVSFKYKKGATTGTISGPVK